MALIRNREFAIPEGIPELDCSITRARDNLAVICGEGDRKDIVGMADEAASCVTGSQFPETERLIP
jgi:hypothetical protein